MKPKKKKKKSPLIAFIFSIVFLLSLIQLMISHRLATAGEAVKKLEQEALALEQENKRLEEEINGLGALNRIAQKAENLGLVNVKNILYLTSPMPVALDTNRIP